MPFQLRHKEWVGAAMAGVRSHLDRDQHRCRFMSRTVDTIGGGNQTFAWSK
jgi:hypothetical protein